MISKTRGTGDDLTATLRQPMATSKQPTPVVPRSRGRDGRSVPSLPVGGAVTAALPARGNAARADHHGAAPASGRLQLPVRRRRQLLGHVTIDRPAAPSSRCASSATEGLIHTLPQLVTVPAGQSTAEFVVGSGAHRPDHRDRQSPPTDGRTPPTGTYPATSPCSLSTVRRCETNNARSAGCAVSVD